MLPEKFSDSALLASRASTCAANGVPAGLLATAPRMRSWRAVTRKVLLTAAVSPVAAAMSAYPSAASFNVRLRNLAEPATLGTEAAPLVKFDPPAAAALRDTLLEKFSARTSSA